MQVDRDLQCRFWVKSAVLTFCQLLLVYLEQRTLSDRPGWSGWYQEKTLAPSTSSQDRCSLFTQRVQLDCMSAT
jgi:hypothetical protein